MAKAKEMIKLYKDFLIGSAYLYLFQGINYIIPLLILPFLLHKLSLESFGIFAFSQSFIQFLILIVDFGFNLSASKKIAALPKGSSQVASIYWAVICAKFWLLLAVLGAVFTCFALFDYWAIYESAVYVSLISLVGTVIFPVWLYQGLNEMKAMNLITGISKVVSLPFIFVLVRHSDDYLQAVFLYSASTVIAGIISFVFYLTKKEYRLAFNFKFTAFGSVIKQIREGWLFFLSNASISLYTNSLVLILGYFGTPSQVGIFGAIERCVRVICFAVYVPINQTAYSMIAILKHRDYDKAILLFRAVFYFVLVLMPAIILIFFAFGSSIYDLLGPTINLSKLQIAIFSILPIALGGVCGQLGLVALGDEKQKRVFSNIYFFVGFGSLCLCFFAIKLFNVDGAIFSMMVTEFSIFLLMLTAVKRYKLI